MNKIIFTLLVLASASSVGFAQEAPKAVVAPKVTAPAAAAVKKAPVAVMALAGAVKSVSVADAAKKTKSEVVVSDASGKLTTVVVSKTTTLYDMTAKAITLDKIAVGSNVAVAYVVNAEGLNKARSIKIVK